MPRLDIALSWERVGVEDPIGNNSTSVPYIPAQMGLLPSAGQGPALSYVVVLKLLATLTKTPLTAVAKVLSDPIAASVRSTNSNAYSVRSCPFSSFHSLTKSCFILVSPGSLNRQDHALIRAKSTYRRRRNSRLRCLQNYVVLRFDAALANTPLTAVASVLSEPIAAKVSSTRSNAYSVRSWPRSSFQSCMRTVFISFFSFE